MIHDIIEKAKIERKNVFIYTHKNPDVDSIFSAYAVGEYLKNFGVKSRYVMQNSSKAFRVQRNTDTSNSISILLDTASTSQIDSSRFMKSWKGDIYVYDHHTRSSDKQMIEEELDLPKNNFVRLDKLTSTCEVLFKDFNRKKITPRVAYFLLVGILANTGMLRYPKQDTFESVRQLMNLGANYDECAKEILASKLDLEIGVANAMKHAKKIPLGNLFCLMLYFNHEKVKLFEETYGVRNIHKKINKLNTIEACPISVVIAENKPGEFDIRFRSNEIYGNYDAHDIAEKYNGGGNSFASGCHLSVNDGFDGQRIVTMLMKDIYDRFAMDSIKSTTITPHPGDEALKGIMIRTNNLSTRMSIDIIDQLEKLHNAGTNYEYILNEFNSYEQFMLKNEILSKIPVENCKGKYPTVRLELSEAETTALKEKYNITDEDILNSIKAFRSIKMHSMEIVLPDGNSAKRINYTAPPPSNNFDLRY